MPDPWDILKTLADSTRLRIIHLLDRDECSVAEMQEGFARAAHVKLSWAEAEAIHATFDVDGSGEVDVGEMLPIFRAIARAENRGTLDLIKVEEPPPPPPPFLGLASS